MLEENKLQVMNMSFSGIMNLGKNFKVDSILENSREINWEFIEEIGKGGCERPPRLIGKMKEGKFPTIIIYPSGKFQIMGSKSKKQARIVFEIALKEIKSRKKKKEKRNDTKRIL